MHRNPAVAAELAAKYAEQFSLLHACIRLGDEYMAAASKGTLDTASKAILNTIFTRIYNNLCAITLVLEEGYGVEAGMLTRGFIEGFFDVCYIVNYRDLTRPEIDADYLAQRYVRYQHVAHFLSVEQAVKAGMSVRPDELADAELERQREWDTHYGWKGAWKGKGESKFHDWSGLQTETKAERGNVVEVYHWLNRIFSEMVHGGPDAWRLLVDEDEGGHISFLAGPQDLSIELPIPAVGSLFSLAVQLVAEHTELSTMAERGGKVHDAVNRTFGDTLGDAP